MYAWQTLTLAKVQYRGNSVKAQAVVKDVLYLIGLPHFPDPVVLTIGEGQAVRLRWDVEGRALQIDVDQLGVVSYDQFYTDDSHSHVDSGGVDLGTPHGRHAVSTLVGWLLFGEREMPEVESGEARLKAQKLRDECKIQDELVQGFLNRKQRSLKEVANDVVDGLKR